MALITKSHRQSPALLAGLIASSQWTCSNPQQTSFYQIYQVIASGKNIIQDSNEIDPLNLCSYVIVPMEILTGAYCSRIKLLCVFM